MGLLMRGRPSRNILIRNKCMVSASISIGNEMSCRVLNVSGCAVRIKTALEGVDYVKYMRYRNLKSDNVLVGLVIKTDYNEHPDEGFDPKAVSRLEDNSYTSLHAEGVRVPSAYIGSGDIPI